MYRVIYSFHMPLFMTISGYFAVSSLKKSFTQTIVAKTRQLLLPCVTVSLLLAATHYIFIQENFGADFKFQLLYALWFLKTLFFCFIISFVCYKCGRFKNIALLITLIMTQMPQMSYIHYLTTNIEIMYPSYIAGILIKEHWSIIERYSKTIMIVTCVIFGAMLLFWSKDFWQPTGAMMYELKALNLSSALYLMYIRYYRLIIGLAGSIFFILLSYRLLSKQTNNKFVKITADCGKYTMGIYIMQFLLFEEGISKFLNFDGMNFYVFNFLFVPLFSAILMGVCTIIVKMIERNKLLSFLLLGKGL